MFCVSFFRQYTDRFEVLNVIFFFFSLRCCPVSNEGLWGCNPWSCSEVGHVIHDSWWPTPLSLRGFWWTSFWGEIPPHFSSWTYVSSTAEYDDIILYVPGTQLTLGLIGVWAFFWKVEPPPQVSYCINPSTPSRFIDSLAHLHVSLCISADLGMVNGYISDTKGMGMRWYLDTWRWGGVVKLVRDLKWPHLER